MIGAALAILILASQPQSCRDLDRAVRRCQFDGCNVMLIERLRKQCTTDSEKHDA